MNTPCIGILGGMGPLASAAFINTIYQQWTGEIEQSAPRVLLHSDPSFPDRTTLLLDGRDDVLLERLDTAIGVLSDAGATRIVICCMTIHCLLPRLPPARRRPVVSLLDTAFELVRETPGRHVLLCATGSRQVRLFEQHAAWPEVADRLIMPTAEDQRAVHGLI